MQFLVWLGSLPGFVVENGGVHQVVVSHKTWKRKFPVPFKHNIIKKPILIALVKQILATGTCTKDEIDEHLR